MVLVMSGLPRVLRTRQSNNLMSTWKNSIRTSSAESVDCWLGDSKVPIRITATQIA
jgi:hypothetical protein